jgi:hypothetical protein
VRESVTATGTARRTVRTAVALLVSQALLCGLIGWLTFGRSPASEPRPGVQAVDPLVPPVATTASTPARESIGPAATATPAAASTAAARRLPPPRRTGTWPAPGRLPAEPPATAAPAEPPPAPLVSTPTPTASGGGLLPPAPPSPSSAPLVQQPVTVGDHCHPEWSFGRTAAGTLVRCLRSGPHRQRWKIV